MLREVRISSSDGMPAFLRLDDDQIILKLQQLGHDP